MAELEVRSEDVGNLVRAIGKHADAKALRRELYSGLNRATKRIRGEMTEVIPAALPRRGGLADEIQAATKSRATAKAGRYAGVSVRFSARGHDIRLVTGRRLRHPVWGNRDRWVDQTEGIEPAVFMAEFAKQAPEVQKQVQRVLEDIARKVTNI